MHQFNIVFAIRRAGNKIKRLLLQIDWLDDDRQQQQQEGRVGDK
jgi:hypothetical protein